MQPGNGVHPTNGSAETAPATSKRVLRVVVPRDGDDNACLRLLEQLHVLVERFPGQDELQLVLHDRTGARIQLEGTEIAVNHSNDLVVQMRSLVGEDNLQVLTAAAP